MPKDITADILRHEKKTLSYGLYSSGSSMHRKIEAIEKLVYPGIAVTTRGQEVEPCSDPKSTPPRKSAAKPSPEPAQVLQHSPQGHQRGASEALQEQACGHQGGVEGQLGQATYDAEEAPPGQGLGRYSQGGHVRRAADRSGAGRARCQLRTYSQLDSPRRYGGVGD